MNIGYQEISRITVVRSFDGETVAEITDSVIEELDGYEVKVEMACEVVVD